MLKKITFVLLLCGAFTILPLTIHAADPKPVVIDSDMTTDDYMATLYLLNNPDFSVKAITVTGTGWAFCDAGVRAAQGLVALAKYADIPVSCWTDKPLLGDSPVPDDWRTTMASVDALKLPEGSAATDLNAVDLFTKTLQASSEKVTVLAIGPLTNIAQALTTTPALVDKIDMIYIMGGAVDAPGSGVSDENKSAEWNIYLDPLAARLVFESGAPITLVPLDATNDVPVTPEFLKTLEASQKTPESTLMYTVLSGSADSINGGTYFFWDPLAAAVLADPSLVTLTDRMVDVVDTPGADFGRTRPVGNGPHIWVATKPDGATFEQRLLDAWNAGS
ncbi:MAG: hypothetical protein GC204_01585 [Chloroflexi bacterium]|nr:hypothetical protein [Chloroflexota bacterium]